MVGLINYNCLDFDSHLEGNTLYGFRCGDNEKHRLFLR